MNPIKACPKHKASLEKKLRYSFYKVRGAMLEAETHQYQLEAELKYTNSNLKSS